MSFHPILAILSQLSIIRHPPRLLAEDPAPFLDVTTLHFAKKTLGPPPEAAEDDARKEPTSAPRLKLHKSADFL